MGVMDVVSVVGTESCCCKEGWKHNRRASNSQTILVDKTHSGKTARDISNPFASALVLESLSFWIVAICFECAKSKIVYLRRIAQVPTEPKIVELGSSVRVYC